jgi:hypothetical protein
MAAASYEVRGLRNSAGSPHSPRPAGTGTSPVSDGLIQKKLSFLPNDKGPVIMLDLFSVRESAVL